MKDLYNDIEKLIEYGVELPIDDTSTLYAQQVLKEYKASSRQQFLERKYFKSKKCLPFGYKPLFVSAE